MRSGPEEVLVVRGDHNAHVGGGEGNSERKTRHWTNKRSRRGVDQLVRGEQHVHSGLLLSPH